VKKKSPSKTPGRTPFEFPNQADSLVDRNIMGTNPLKNQFTADDGLPSHKAMAGAGLGGRTLPGSDAK
jgi:hypothetical protein